jgi:type II secretory pathway pseudopilin PulG
MRGCANQAGFTYIVVLIAVAIIGATLALTGSVWHTEVKREKESELLFVGGEFRRAINQYYRMGGQYPMNLADMVKDPRQSSPVRHLRKLYPDPITGKKEWGLLRGPNNGIVAVYSLSQDAPLKTGGFALVDQMFEGKQKYSEWVFFGLPVGSVTQNPLGNK